jgi:hypothetical protein
MSDEDLANNTFGFNARKLERYIKERAETIKEIKDILNNQNFNIALLPNDKTATLLTAIVSANDGIINLYTNLYATKENPPQIDEVLNRVKFTFEMNTNSDDDDDSDSDGERENKKKKNDIANERYDKLISIIKKMKGKRTRDNSSSNSSNKYSRRNEDTDDDDEDNYNNDDVDMTELNTVFNNLKSKGGRRSRKLRSRKLRSRKLRSRKLRNSRKLRRTMRR